MASRINMDGIDVVVQDDNLGLDQIIKNDSGETSQVVLAKKDGSFELREVDDLRQIPASQVAEINRIQHPIRQGA